MTVRLPGETRMLAVLAAAVLVGALISGLSFQRAGAIPSFEINACASQYTGQIIHSEGRCLPGTYAVDLYSGPETMCVSKYTGAMSYRPSGDCVPSEFPVEVGGLNTVWGCVSPWTGKVRYLSSPVAPCYGSTMPFPVDNSCLVSALAADKPVWAPAC